MQYSIDRDTVHVWRAYITTDCERITKYVSSLSVEEVDRARRFIRQPDRDRYISAHGVLRSILGAYIGCPPSRLAFEMNNYGKPRLVNSQDGHDIQFNLSHSGDMILIALSSTSAVGIDVEYIRKYMNVYEIVNSVFSDDERKYLNSLPAAEIEERFFACWTAKEAFLKGIGEGLTYPLDNFSIVFSNGVPSGIKYIKDDPVRYKCWTIIGLFPGPGYSGALAVEELRSEPIFYDYC